MKPVSNQSSRSATYRLENIVISVNLNQKIPLKEFTEKFHDMEYDAARFPSICVHLRSPKCAILIFANGKLVIAGLKRIKDADEVIEKVIEKLKGIGIEIKDKPEVKIANLVVSLDLNHKINLDDASLILDQTVYEPEVFPGLIYRIYFEDLQKNIVFLIFSSGRAIITGIKEESHIPLIIKTFGKQLRTVGLLD